MKSLATSVFWPAWEWLRYPERRFLSVSHSAGLATRDALKTRRLMQSEGMQQVDEDFRVLNRWEPSTILQKVGYRGVLEAIGKKWDFTGDQNVKARYENDKTGYRIATSIGGGATGEGGDRIMIDDPHKLEEWDSEAKLKEAVEFVTEIAPSRLNSQSAAIVMIMQRIHEHDATAAVLGQVEDKPGWIGDVVHLCLPELYEASHPFLWPEDPRVEEGDFLWPERFDEKGVAEHKGQGSLRYAGNYQQRPAPAEGNIFKKEDWRYYGPGGDRPDLPPTWERVLNSWDLTFGDSDDPGASWVVGQCWGLDGADAYLLAQVGARMSFPAQKRAVKVLRAFSPLDQVEMAGLIVVEEKAAGKPLLEELRIEVPGLKGVNPGTSKVARAVAVQGYQEVHNLWLPRGVIPAPAGFEPTPTETFVHECATFPAGADDQVDTMSQALQELYHVHSNEAISVSAIPDHDELVIKCGGKTRVGEKYADQAPPASWGR